MLERHFPERRLFLRSEDETRFIRLRPGTQLIAFAGSAALIAWTIIASAILLMDTIGAGNYRSQAIRDQQTYQTSLNAMAEERDLRLDVGDEHPRRQRPEPRCGSVGHDWSVARPRPDAPPGIR